MDSKITIQGGLLYRGDSNRRDRVDGPAELKPAPFFARHGGTMESGSLLHQVFRLHPDYRCIFSEFDAVIFYIENNI